MADLNVVTIILAALCILPVLAGALGPFSREQIRYSLGSLLDNVEFLAGILLSIYLTKRIFFENEGSFFQEIYEWIPDRIKDILQGQDILTYIISVPVILLLMLLVLRLFTTPFYRAVIVPLADRLHSRINTASSGVKRLIGALWQIPRAIYLPLIFALLLNFFTYYFYTPVLARWMNESQAYQFLYKNALNPVLNSNLAKQIPVLVNDSFRNVLGKVVPQDGASVTDKIGESLGKGNIRVIEYFNGVTLDEAIKSTPEIDETARKIVGKEKDDAKKGYLLYKWVSKNIKYDFEKAERIVSDTKSYSSGSAVAFGTRKGICFDYSCLYVSMCRAVGLKVRLVTGLGYSGVSWGDHSWNQVYDSAGQRWINLDATFGSSGANYFDKADFQVDHRDADVQGEW